MKTSSLHVDDSRATTRRSHDRSDWLRTHIMREMHDLLRVSAAVQVAKLKTVDDVTNGR